MTQLFFEDALSLMRQGQKLTTQEILENPFIKEYYYILYGGCFYRTYIENGLICKMCPTQEEILARNLFIAR